MGVYIDDNNYMIITKPKTNCFDLTKNVDGSLKHEFNFIIKYNGFLAEHIIEDVISQLLSKYKYEKYIHEHRKH